jgi:hypothetical protein
MGAGFTITRMSRIGQTFTFPNNRVWPFGVPQADVNHPDYPKAEAMRKAVHRLIDVDTIVAEIYTDPVTGISLMSKAERWLPPGMETWTAMGQEPWIPDLTVPQYDPCEAATILDNAGFVQGTTLNLDYDPEFPCSAQYMRKDPTTGEDLFFTYKAIGEMDSPLGWAMALMISDWFKKAGLGHELQAITWFEMVVILVNPYLEDYQFMTGVGIIWGTTAPDILVEFTHSEKIPLWNFVYMNFSEADYWGDEMMRTLNLTRVLEAAVRIQEVLAAHEPYRPLLLWNLFGAITGEWEYGVGGHRIVNMAGVGFMGYSYEPGLLHPRAQITHTNVWNKQRMWSGRYSDEKKINLWIYDDEICSQNPLEADCEVDWSTILANVYDVLWRYTPFYRSYWPWAAIEMPVTSPWVGPGGSKHASGNGVYDAPYDVGPDGEWGTDDDTYNGIPVADVTAGDLVGDDQLGMVTTWVLRDDLYWHDSDPGPDLKFGTDDDGTVYPVISADVEFMARLMMNKTGIPGATYENVRYYGTWQYFAGYGRGGNPDLDPEGPFAVEIVDRRTFKIFEERRYIFAFESHNILLLGAQHIWEPYVLAGGDPATWTGYEEQYMVDPILDRVCKATPIPLTFEGICAQHNTAPYYLTYQIGFGPFVYHYGGWTPGVSTRIEVNPLYFAGTSLPTITDPQYHRGFPHPADVDLEVYYNPELPAGLQYYGSVDLSDISRVLDAFGSWPGAMPDDPMWYPTADLKPPTQEVGGTEVVWVLTHIGETWGPGYPPSGGTDP